MSGTKFPWRLWYWTGSHESLFELNTSEIWWFKAFVAEALKDKS